MADNDAEWLTVSRCSVGGKNCLHENCCFRFSPRQNNQRIVLFRMNGPPAWKCFPKASHSIRSVAQHSIPFHMHIATCLPTCGDEASVKQVIDQQTVNSTQFPIEHSPYDMLRRVWRIVQWNLSQNQLSFIFFHSVWFICRFIRSIITVIVRILSFHSTIPSLVRLTVNRWQTRMAFRMKNFHWPIQGQISLLMHFANGRNFRFICHFEWWHISNGVANCMAGTP